MSGTLSLKTSDGQNHEFKSGYDLWVFCMLHKPHFFLSERMTDGREIADVVRTAKMSKKSS